MKVSAGQEQLIEAVRKRPVIYSKYHPQFSNRALKQELWYEVCNEIIPQWQEFSCGKKGEKVCEVQRRWRTLRDGFSRELQFQKQDQLKRNKGELVRKRKIYGYFNQLKFLLKQKKKPLDVQKDDVEDDDDSDEMTISNTREEESDNISFKTEPATSYYVDVCDIQNKECESNKISLDNERTYEEDEDRLFCLSLVPSFKKMTEKQKYEARIGIMQVLSEVRFKNDSVDL